MSHRVRIAVIGAIAVALAVAGVVAVAAPPAAAPTGEPRITRLFIPAIKADCRERARVPADAVIGYTFAASGAVETLDRDGSLTGVEPEVLQAFNACLAQYPIQPLIELPRDHYQRNLLYDYYLHDLRPCLSERVTDLPAMPSRADFVVRLYLWDPYRVLARTLPLDRLLEDEGACPALPGWMLD